MKTLWTGILCVLLPRLALATACNSNCTFKRGDANCDGAITSADLNAIYYLSITNYDAADVNDDGAVTLADLSALSSFISTGSPVPACPGPYTAGKDCTADNLENCCSPPTAQTTITHHDCVVSIDQPTNNDWDYVDWDANDLGSTCYGWGSVYNDDHCEHSPSNAAMDVSAQVTDSVGFTKKRLQNNVQKAYLYIDVDVWFDTLITCIDNDCEDQNALAVVLEPGGVAGNFSVIIKAAPAVGGTGDEFSWDQIGAESFLYVYSQVFQQHCVHVTVHDDHQGAVLGPFDVTSDLAALPPNDCDVWEITEVNLKDMELKFIRVIGTTENIDIVEFEGIEVLLSAWVQYEWCDDC